MKKLTAILLVALFAFNLFGYRILFYSIQHQSDISFERSLDDNRYNEKDLITIKVPLSIPYQASSTDFERCDGEIDYNGVIYKYVKRKVSNGELILMCLPYEAKMHLENAKNNLFKNTNDLQSSSSEKSNSSKSDAGKNLPNDYNQVINEYTLSSLDFLNKVNSINTKSSLASPFSPSDDHPPQVL